MQVSKKNIIRRKVADPGFMIGIKNNKINTTRDKCIEMKS